MSVWILHGCDRVEHKDGLIENGNFQAFRVMPVTTSLCAVDHSAPVTGQLLSQGGWLAGITFSVNLGTP